MVPHFSLDTHLLGMKEVKSGLKIYYAYDISSHGGLNILVLIKGLKRI